MTEPRDDKLKQALVALARAAYEQGYKHGVAAAAVGVVQGDPQ